MWRPGCPAPPPPPRPRAKKISRERPETRPARTSGNPIGAEGRIQGGGVLSIERPCASAISRQGLRSAECSQPQPRSIGRRGSSPIVQARPPSRWRASINRQSIPASFSLRHAATPAAPPPTITTSVSLFATRCSATIGRKGRLRHQAHNVRLRLGHDPEKWIPVFGKDHAPTARRREPDRDGKKKLSFWPSPPLAMTERTHHRKIRRFTPFRVRSMPAASRCRHLRRL